MVERTSPNLIRRVQTEIPRGAPFDREVLDRIGVSPALASHYVRAGWAVRLGRGVFKFPNDDLRLDETLKFLARGVAEFHVGGKTALAWRGTLHNISTREPLSLWGKGRFRLPEWFREAFPARYTARNPFSPRLPREFGLEPMPGEPEGVAVSVPERALLEMLSEVGIHQGVEEARNIMEGVRALRSDVLAVLLRHCDRVKARRLCVQWAEELSLPWAAEARKSVGKRTGTARWSARLKDGTVLVLKG